MKIVSIEPTPSPNNMKLNMNESLPNGVTYNFTEERQAGAPDYIKQLLAIHGVKGVFQVNDFIAIERHPKTDWEQILPLVRGVFEKGATAQTSRRAEGGQTETTPSPSDAAGEITVYIQMFKGIPMQIKLTTETEEKRVALPERFVQAVMRAQPAASNLVLERKWIEQGVRYGKEDEVGEQVKEELMAAYDEDRLNRLVEQALKPPSPNEEKREEITPEAVLTALDHPDWKKRYAALERMNPTKEALPALEKALNDPKMSVRRLATAYIGMIEDADVLPILFRALKDKSATVRRTAGDCLSDLGDPRAIGPMAEALKDPNKIVRWRAARFLYEVGDESAVPALRQAQDDPAFEVRMQIKMALERIEGGHTAEGTVWQQMTRAISERNEP